MNVVHHRLLSALLLLMAGVSVASATEIPWRSEYSKAMTEASQTGKPLFIDIGSDNCYWCRQLEARTFVDEEIRRILTERFIPLKVNGTKNTYLVQALRIQSYPTMVFASPDGSILGYKEGFQDAATLKQVLTKVLSDNGTPDWMTTDFEAANKAIAGNNPAHARELLVNIVSDGKDRPIQAKARQMLVELEKRANEPIARQTPAVLMSRTAESRQQTAVDLLEQAKKDLQAGRFVACLDRCDMLTEQFSDLPQGKESAGLAEQIKENGEWTQKTCEQLTDRLGTLYMAQATVALRKGQPQQAMYYLERVIILTPGSRLAEQAQSQLAKLRGVPK